MTNANLTRRLLLRLALSSLPAVAFGGTAKPQSSRMSFKQWVATFRPRALARGISGKTYDRVMSGLKPDTSVYAQDRNQPEFSEKLWQYLNRRCSASRVKRGRERAEEYKDLFARIEHDYGVDRYILLGLWGMESSFGDVVDNPKYMQPVIPALAALAWGEPRRRHYWEQELLNALVIVDRGWAEPTQMVGSWAGAMGHTQWMPEVWLGVGTDYNKNGRVTPFEVEDSLAGTAYYLEKRGKYRRGEPWGCEVRLPASFNHRLADKRTKRNYAQWQKLGVSRADGKAFTHGDEMVRLWLPERGGPAFLIGQNYFAVRSYNPADAYTLALVHLGDLIRGDPDFVQQFPGGERRLTLDEMQDLQRRLTAAGFGTGGTDGRFGQDTIDAVRAYQKKFGITPADGYPGLKILARLRQS
ncbi:MAG TPA: lytic murein transglycosylase [Xanthobacteraceae bacterium]|nr:lytic murein transglycosylase [Xanthobacteraceae bacterium]